MKKEHIFEYELKKIKSKTKTMIEKRGILLLIINDETLSYNVQSYRVLFLP